MRGAVQKLLVLALAAGLVASGPVCSHAQMEPCGAAISHETKDVPIYADLSVDPADDGSLQAELPAEGPHHDDGLCKKCCAICIGANLPVTTLALMTLSASEPDDTGRLTTILSRVRCQPILEYPNLSETAAAPNSGALVRYFSEGFTMPARSFLRGRSAFIAFVALWFCASGVEGARNSKRT